MRGSEFSGPLPDSPIRSHKIVRFNWDYRDHSTATHGDGVIRIAPPDSARVDFFLPNGLGGGSAVLIGNGPIRSSDSEEITNMLPSPPLVWASVGRLAVPSAADTVKLIDEGVLSAELRGLSVWRAVFDGPRLTSLTRAEGRRAVESVTRATTGTVTYVRGKTALRLTDLKEENANPFSPDIWRN